MKLASLTILTCFLFNLGFGQIFKSVSLLNGCEYISSDPTEVVYAGLENMGIDAKMKAVLIDLNSNSTTKLDVNWLFQNKTTNGWSGVNKWIFTKGIFSNDKDIYLVFLNNGDGSGNLQSWDGTFMNLYVFNLNTQKRVFSDSIGTLSQSRILSSELIFSKTGIYFSFLSVDPVDAQARYNNQLFKINNADITTSINGIEGTKIPLFKKGVDARGRTVVFPGHVKLF